MCGVLAVLNYDGVRVDRDLLLRMRDTMFHRGPDGEGIYLNGPVGLAHRRLAVIDLSDSGRQPMTNEDGTVFLVFNGEIYNYIELREELIKKGHRFSSTSDTEVIIHQYEEDGELCVEKFNGMFSFILWDETKQKLLAARDRLGIKPLYYYVDHQKIILASEMKAIVEDPGVPRRPDFQGIADYFYAGRPLGNKTLFQNVKELEPGYLMSIDKSAGHLQIKKYWDVSYNYNYARTEDDLRDQLFSLLSDSVKVNCRSDASLGCHLSGGLDSSVIVALSAKYRKDLQAFSIKFAEGRYYDETPYAKIVAGHVGAGYHESFPSKQEMAALLPFLIWHMDAPMVAPGGFGYFAVSQLASRFVKVALTGHGGDELFGGYPAQFKAAYNNTDMFALHPHTSGPGTSSVMKRVGRLFNRNPLGIFRSVKGRFLNEEQTFENKWIQFHCSGSVDQGEIFQKNFTGSLFDYSSRVDYLKPFGEVTTDQIFDKCLYHDQRVYLPSLLHMEDRLSMSLSLESRVPLLDHRLVEFLATVPPEQKIKGMQPKYLLRQAASAVLPEEIWARKDKFPFPIADDFWSSKEFIEMAEKILLSPESMDRGVFKPEALKAACRSTPHYNRRNWAILNTELWFKVFIDQNSFWLSQVKSRRPC
jgi:asparagine synthase (glutamine-hydrolysing)